MKLRIRITRTSNPIHYWSAQSQLSTDTIQDNIESNVYNQKQLMIIHENTKKVNSKH